MREILLGTEIILGTVLHMGFQKFFSAVPRCVCVVCVCVCVRALVVLTAFLKFFLAVKKEHTHTHTHTHTHFREGACLRLRTSFCAFSICVYYSVYMYIGVYEKLALG